MYYDETTDPFIEFEADFNGTRKDQAGGVQVDAKWREVGKFFIRQPGDMEMISNKLKTNNMRILRVANLPQTKEWVGFNSWISSLLEAHKEAAQAKEELAKAHESARRSKSAGA